MLLGMMEIKANLYSRDDFKGENPVMPRLSQEER